MTRTPTPNYTRFDFERFVDELLARDLSFVEFFQAFDRECGRAEQAMSGRGGPQARADGGVAYAARLKRVLFWFHHGMLGDKGQEATTCHRLAEKLAARGDLKPAALDAFSKPSSAG